MTQDYWEVGREEIVVLAIIFPWCAIWAGAAQDIFCEAEQELHECLAPVVEEGDLFNIEKNIWEGLGKTLWLLLPQKEPPHQKETPH